MNYVATASDALPNYAALLPITIRIWRRFGYGGIAVLHDDPRWEATEFGRLVVAELEGCRIIRLPTASPLSVANTMRVGRMTAACLPDLVPADVLVYSDADYWPLAPCMCPPDPPAIVGHLNVYWPIINADRRLTLGESHFGFQHSCQSVAHARAVLPIVVGDPAATMRGFGAVRDDIDLDQATWAHRVLRGPGVDLGERVEVPPSHCRFGDLELRSWPDAPQWYTGVHPGTIIHHHEGLHDVEKALNFIPPRADGKSQIRFDTVRMHHPWLEPWITTYWARVESAMKGYPWA